MTPNDALVALHRTGWKIKMHNTSVHGCEFAIVVKKSGLGIGTFGLQGSGATPDIAILQVMKKVKKVIGKHLGEDNAGEDKISSSS